MESRQSRWILSAWIPSCKTPLRQSRGRLAHRWDNPPLAEQVSSSRLKQFLLCNRPPQPLMQDSKSLLVWIMVALIIWGALLALGAYLYNHNIWRLIIVMGSVGGFLAFWALLLWSKKDRTS